MLRSNRDPQRRKLVAFTCYHRNGNIALCDTRYTVLGWGDLLDRLHLDYPTAAVIEVEEA